jgi:hypothetical protein
MLNRLMFVYFIQQKGFLDGNPNYLADRMQPCARKQAKESSIPSTASSCAACFMKAWGSTNGRAVLIWLADWRRALPQRWAVRRA